MATVSVFGTTVWNDALSSGATKGVGRVQPFDGARSVRWSVVPLPRASGSIAKNLGIESGVLLLRLEYSISAANMSTLKSTLDGLIEGYGTVSYPPSQSKSNCILISHTFPGRRPELDDGSIVYRFPVQLRFRRLR